MPFYMPVWHVAQKLQIFCKKLIPKTVVYSKNCPTFATESHKKL